MIIAIDGPAGSGKTTVAKRLAKKLNIVYLDTGATYRALTLQALRQNIPLDDEAALSRLADRIKVVLRGDKVFCNGEDVTQAIRTPAIDTHISKPVSFKEVRRHMVRLQREIIQAQDAVIEGRDTTTVVYPNADYKFYLDADNAERAKRRHKELCARGLDTELDEVRRQMAKRDAADVSRKVSPLRKAHDAICIDTTNLSIDEVVAAIAAHIRQ